MTAPDSEGSLLLLASVVESGLYTRMLSCWETWALLRLLCSDFGFDCMLLYAAIWHGLPLSLTKAPLVLLLTRMNLGIYTLCCILPRISCSLSSWSLPSAPTSLFRPWTESICCWRKPEKSSVGLFYLILILAISNSCLRPIGGVVPNLCFLMYYFSKETTGAVITLRWRQI